MKVPASLSPKKLSGWFTVAVVLMGGFGCGGPSPEEQLSRVLGKGNTYYRSGLYKEALTQFQRALDLKSNDPQIHLLVARCQERLGLTTEALASYTRAIELDETLVEAYQGKAFLLLQQHKTRQLERFLEDLKRRKGMEALVFYLEGENALAGNDLNRAVESFRKALEKDPGLTAAAKSLAKAYQQSGDFDAAVDLLKGLIDDSAEGLASAFQLAQLYDVRGDTEEAVKILSSLVPQFPRSAPLLSQVAFYQLKLGRREAAEETARKALELAPNDPLGLYVSGKTALARGDIQTALQDLKTAVERRPEEDLFQEAYREARYTAGELVDKVRVARDRIDSEGRNVRTLAQLAEAYLYRGEPSNALPAVHDALSIEPENTGLKVLEALALFCSGRVVEARHAVENLANTEDPRLAAMKGLIDRDTDLLRKAVDRLRSETATQPWAGYFESIGHLMENRIDLVLRGLDRLQETYPDFGMPLYEMARLYERMNETVLAGATYQVLIQKFPESDKPKILLARLLAESGKAERALVLVQSVLADDPENEAARFLEGTIRLQQGDYAAAEDVLASLIDLVEKRGKSSRIYRGLLAKTYVLKGEYEKAAAEYDRLLEHDPDTTGAYIEKALSLLAANDTTRALAACEEGLKSGTETSVLNIVKAVVLQQQGKGKEALDAFEEGVSGLTNREKVGPALSAIRAGLLMTAGRFEEASETVRSGGLHPQLIRYFLETIDRSGRGEVDLHRLNLGLLFSFYRWPEAALTVFQSLAEQNPDDRLVLAYLGEACRKAKRFEEAYTAFSKGVTLAPDDLYFLRAKAGVEAELGRYEEAVRDYLLCISKSPKDPGLQFDLARVYERQGLLEDASAAYERALKLNPPPRMKSAVANNLAWLLSSQEDRLDEALKYAQTALESCPDEHPDANILDTLGWIHFKKGNLKEARDALSRALRFSPLQPTLNYHMGRVYEEMGELKAAIHHYLKAIHLDPEFPEAEDARPRIPLLRSRISE